MVISGVSIMANGW